MKKITINQGEYTLEEITKLFEEKTILKYPNGAVVEDLEFDQGHYCIYDAQVVYRGRYYSNEDKYDLLTRNIFLTQEEAERELERKIRYFEIINEIDKINRDENWVADWRDGNQKKWYLFYSYMSDCLNNRFVRDKAYTCRRSNIYMSEKAIDWVMNLPDEDKKILIGIYD
jgi:hypothetical protein